MSSTSEVITTHQPSPVTSQPKLASQEDLNEESIKAVIKSSILEDPVLEPLKKSTGFRIVEYVDLGNAQENTGEEERGEGRSIITYEITNSSSNLSFIGKKKFRDVSEAYCHDNQLGCDFKVETCEGKPVMEMEGIPGYSGLAEMHVQRGEESLGKIVQEYDMCAACNPQYAIYSSNGDLLLHIPVLDSGCFCGIFGVKKFLVVSGNKQHAIGDISNETLSSRRNPTSGKRLLADERQPFASFIVTFPEKISIQSKLMLIAATFTVNFHDTVFRFKRGREPSRTEH